MVLQEWVGLVLFANHLSRLERRSSHCLLYAAFFLALNFAHRAR